jgi:iron complex transport system ATP-binding protein
MILDLLHISAGYPDRLVLRDLSLQARGGEVLGVIGANGAGKTTLLRAIGGTLQLRAGSVRLGNLDLGRLDARGRAQKVAVVPQGARLPEAFSVAEVVLLGRTPYLSLLGRESDEDRRIAQQAMAQTDTLQLAERRIGELSGGEQQRVLVARALAQQPQVLLLDEATAHLDLKHQSEILGLARKMARERSLIVIAALHDLNLAALFADRLALLRDGKLLALDEPATVLTPSLLKQAYDIPVIVGRHPIHHTPLVALAPDELAL